jgi:hypothetical protein
MALRVLLDPISAMPIEWSSGALMAAIDALSGDVEPVLDTAAGHEMHLCPYLASDHADIVAQGELARRLADCSCDHNASLLVICCSVVDVEVSAAAVGALVQAQVRTRPLRSFHRAFVQHELQDIYVNAMAIEMQRSRLSSRRSGDVASEGGDDNSWMRNL